MWGFEVKDLVSNAIAVYAAVVATAVAFVEVRRYFREAGKLVVTFSHRGRVELGQSAIYTFVVNVTNSGNRAIGITSVQVHTEFYRIGRKFWEKHPRRIMPFSLGDQVPVMVGADDFRVLSHDFKQEDWDRFKRAGAVLVIYCGNPRRSQKYTMKLPMDLSRYVASHG